MRRFSDYRKHLADDFWFTVVWVDYCPELCICHLRTSEETHAVEGYCGHSGAIERHLNPSYGACTYSFGDRRHCSYTRSCIYGGYVFIHMLAGRRISKEIDPFILISQHADVIYISTTNSAAVS
jgi:hypothetical protein